MNLTVAYRTRSSVALAPDGQAVTLAADLRRDRVAFDARLRHPSPFREAIAAFHDVVIGRPRPLAAGVAQLVTSMGEPSHPDADVLEKRRRYWAARDAYSRHLIAHDPGLWRARVPADPVATVDADGVLLRGVRRRRFGICLRPPGPRRVRRPGRGDPRDDGRR